MAKQKLIPYAQDGKVWDHYFVDPDSNYIYFLKSHNGKKIKFSTHQKVPNGAKAKVYANKEFDRRTGKNKRFVRTTIREEAEAWYLLKQTEGLAYDTLNNVRRGRDSIIEFWGDKLPSDIDRDVFAKWVLFWRAKHPDIQMTNAVKYFNNFCVYLHEKTSNGQPLLPSRLRFKDPNRNDIEAARAEKKERVFTHDEFLRVYATAANWIEALAVQIMYLMATRVTETLSLDFNRILLDLPMPLYRWTKGNNKAKAVGEHALHSTLIEPLRKLRALRQSEGTNLLFPQVINNKMPLKSQQIDWHAWEQRALLDWHWTPHTFKHTCLTNLFNDPANPQLIVCKLYRISIEEAMRTYVKVKDEARLQMKDSIRLDLAPVANLVRLESSYAESLKDGVPKGIKATPKKNGVK